MQKQEPQIFYPQSLSAWRNWLEKYHASEQAVWLVFYSKKSAKRTITWSEAVDVALCFGWIDSKKIKIDEETAHQFFSKRKANSTWSKINKLKVDRLIERELMTEAGYRSIELARQNGSWTILDEVEELVVPKDLEKEFNASPEAGDFYQGLSKSAKKAILQWVALAKRPQTRHARIAEIIRLAEQKQKPKHIP